MNATENPAVQSYLKKVSSFFVTELTRENSLLRSSQGGSKTSTYYNSNDVAIFAVTVHGSFTFS